MSTIDLIFILIIPAIPLLVGLSKSFAPFGGPLVLVSVQLFLGVTLKSLYLSFHSDLFTKHLWLARSHGAYEMALMFMSLFAICICAGYWLASSREDKTMVVRPPSLVHCDKKKATIFLVIAVVSFFVVAFLFVRSRGLIGRSLLDIVIGSNASKVDKIEGVKGFGATNAFITVFFIVPKVCFFLFYSNVVARLKPANYRLGFIVTALLLFLEVILRGKRDALASLFISLLIMTSLVKRKFTLKEIRQYALFIGVSIVLFSVITALRGSTEAALPTTDLNYTENLLEPIVASTYFADINVLASIMERMKDLQHMQGDSYLMLLTGFIPRAFWPGKPAISLGLFVKSVILQSPGSLGGIPPTMPGEAFINFGWLGLGVALLYGFCLRKFEVSMLKGALAARGIGLYVYAIWIVPLTWTLMQSSFAIAMNGILVSVAIAWPLLIFAAKPHSKISESGLSDNLVRSR